MADGFPLSRSSEVQRRGRFVKGRSDIDEAKPHPERVGDGTSLSDRVTAILLLLTAAFVVALRAAPLIDPHDPWVDEAMLLANLPLASLADVFRPLPLFQQATTIGHLVLLDAFVSAFPERTVFVARLLSVVASLLGLLIFYLAMRRLISGAALVAGVLLAGLAPDAVQYSLEIKHYAFEATVTSAVLFASVLLAERVTRARLALMGLCGLFALLFSFTAPIVIAAFGTVLIGRQVILDERLLSRSALSLVLVFAGLAAVFLVLYLGYTHPVTEYQFAAYSDRYNQSLPLPTHLADLKAWIQPIAGMIAPITDLVPYSLLAIPYARLAVSAALVGLAIVGVGAGFLGRARSVVLAVLLVVLLVYILAAVGIFPVTFRRHLLFTLPLTAVLLSLGVGALLAAFSPLRFGAILRGAVVTVTAAAIFYVAAINMLRMEAFERQAVSPLLATVAESDDPVWVYYGAQPAVQVLAPDGFRFLGKVPYDTGQTDWTGAYRRPTDSSANDDYLLQFGEAIRSLERVWLLFSHHWPERDDLAAFRAVAEEAVGNCREVRRTVGGVLLHCGRPPAVERP